jgi:hypothetical protein
MPNLEDQMKNVDLESLPKVDDVPEKSLEEEPEVDETKGESEDEKKERTPENVYRETARKLDKYKDDNQAFQQKLLAQQQEFFAGILDKINTTQAPADKPKASIEDYSVAELTAYRDGLEADNPQRGQLDTLIADKIVNEKVERKVSEFTGKQRNEDMRTKAVEEAVQRYPDLAVKGSDFRRKVDARIQQMDNNYVKSNYRVVLDVANDVAANEGIAAQTARKVIRPPDRPGANKRDSAKPVPKEKEELPMSEAEANKIAKSMKKALGRDFTKEEILEIRKNHADYHAHKHLYTR